MAPLKPGMIVGNISLFSGDIRHTFLKTLRLFDFFKMAHIKLPETAAVRVGFHESSPEEEDQGFEGGVMFAEYGCDTFRLDGKTCMSDNFFKIIRAEFKDMVQERRD